MGYRAIFFLLLVTLAGCYVNKAMVDPFSYAAEGACCYWVPDQKGEELACKEVESCPDLPCEDYKLSLAEVLDIALVNNTTTQISWARARQAAAEYGQSQAPAFPEISADIHHTHSRTTFLASQVELEFGAQSLIVSDQSIWGPQAHVTYTIFDFGERRYTSEAARYALYYADYTHNDAVQSVLEQITVDYYDTLYQKKLLEAKEADLANALETLAAAELALEKGVKSIADVLQARTQALSAEIALSEQHKTQNTSEATLLDDMGLPSNAPISLETLPLIEPTSAQLDPLDDFLDSAFHCRPDLLASRASLRSAEKSLKAAKRQWLPQLDYSLDIGRNYFEGGKHDDYNYTSTFSVSMPIFTGFYIRNTIKQNKAKVEEAKATLKQAELAVIKDVTTSHYNVGVAFETLNAANRFLISANEQYKIAMAQYRAGINTILDVVSAQSSLFDARAQQAQATREWFTALATLAYSAGIITKGSGECLIK